MSALDPLKHLMDDAAAYLGACDFFADIPVYALREKRIGSQLKKSLAGLQPKGGKTGAAVSILTPLLEEPNANLPGINTDLAVIVRCQENPLINEGDNGTGKSAEAIAVQALLALDQFNANEEVGILKPRGGANPNPTANTAMVTYDVECSCKLEVKPLARVATPTAALIGSSVTLTTATEDAAIYYRIDGLYPTPAATLYDSPIALPEGETTLRFAAYLAGSLPSNPGVETYAITSSRRARMGGGFRRRLGGGDRLRLT